MCCASEDFTTDYLNNIILKYLSYGPILVPLLRHFSVVGFRYICLHSGSQLRGEEEDNRDAFKKKILCLLNTDSFALAQVDL